MIEWGWERRRFVHIPNFVDVERLRLNFKVGKVFLYFGRLSQEKGLSTLVRAAAMAKVPAWIVGAGPQERSLGKLAEKTGANVTFVLFYLTMRLFLAPAPRKN